MIESTALGALTTPTKRIMIEHMHHIGSMNGKLIVTYDDFENFRVSRKAIKTVIDIAETLGFRLITCGLL